MGANAFGTGGEHFGFGGDQQRFRGIGELRFDNAENVLIWQWMRMAVVGEITVLANAEIMHGELELIRSEELRKFFAGPAVELAFVTFTVGILGGVEAASGMSHIAKHIGKNVAGNIRVTGVTGDEISIEVQLRELRIVVEHFLEM